MGGHGLRQAVLVWLVGGVLVAACGGSEHSPVSGAAGAAVAGSGERGGSAASAGERPDESEGGEPVSCGACDEGGSREVGGGAALGGQPGASGDEMAQGGQREPVLGIFNAFCYKPAPEACQGSAVSGAAINIFNEQCEKNGGVPGSCPTMDLLGCCNLESAEICYYRGSASLSLAKSTCADAGGAWVATP